MHMFVGSFESASNQASFVLIFHKYNLLFVYGFDGCEGM